MRLFFFVLSIFLSLSTFAQSLNLDAYLAILKEKNLNLQKTDNELAIAAQDVRSAKAALLPNVFLDASYQRDFNKNFLFLNGEDESGLFPNKFQTNFNNTIGANLLAEQPLYNASAAATYKLSQLAQELSLLSKDELTSALTLQATQLYWRAIFVKASIEVLESNAALAKEQWQKKQDLFDQGYASKLEVQQSASFYKRSLSPLQTTKNSYELLLNELRNLAAMPLSSELELLDTLPLSATKIASLQTTQLRLENNKELHILHKQADLASQEIAVAKAAKQPVVNARLGGNFNAQDNAFKFDNNNKLFFGQLTVQVPLFTGGLNNAQIQKAKIKQENAHLALQNQQQNLTKDWENAQLNLASALQKIAEEEELISLTQEELSIAEESSKLGLLTPLEIKEIRLQLTQSRLNLLNAHLDLRIAQAQMKRIVGSH